MPIILKNLQKKIPIPQKRILKDAQKAIQKLDSPLKDLSIVFVGTKRMRTINNTYLKHDFVTDVLTFEISQEMGEIIICPQAAFINARSYQTSTDNELVRYVIHGILHLAGFDDHKPQDILRMRQMEERLL